MEAGDYDNSIKIASEVLDADMDNHTALYILVRCFHQLKRPGLSAACGRSMVLSAHQQGALEASHWSNFGLAYLLGFQCDKAVDLLRKAIELDPKYFPAVHNLSCALQFDGRPQEAIHWAQRAHEIWPEDHGPLQTQGYCYLMMQQWGPGWMFYNAGMGMSKDRCVRMYTGNDLPVWDGTKGQTVVLYAEQGIGDEIVFTQYAHEMMKDCNLIIETCQTMYELFRSSFDCPVYPTRYTDDPPWIKDHKLDAKLSFTQGMQLYRSKHESFTGKPHLKAPEEKRRWWRAILDTYPGQKIGVAWTAGLPHTGKRLRTMEAEDFLPILTDKNNTYICLEYLPTAKKELERLKKNHDVDMLFFGDWINGKKDYSDTAALVAELDRVVAATTTVADLAGAMGVPADVFVPTKPFWRQWGKNVWYESVNWIHQQGTWSETVEKYWRSSESSLHWLRSQAAS
jgi:tetratricopeptide (TPR) repeat protein